MSNDPHHPEEDPQGQRRLVEIAAGGCVSRVLAVAARLRIADILDGGFMSPGHIAEPRLRSGGGLRRAEE